MPQAPSNQFLISSEIVINTDSLKLSNDRLTEINKDTNEEVRNMFTRLGFGMAGGFSLLAVFVANADFFWPLFQDPVWYVPCSSSVLISLFLIYIIKAMTNLLNASHLNLARSFKVESDQFINTLLSEDKDAAASILFESSVDALRVNRLALESCGEELRAGYVNLLVSAVWLVSLFLICGIFK